MIALYICVCTHISGRADTLAPHQTSTKHLPTPTNQQHKNSAFAFFFEQPVLPGTHAANHDIKLHG